MGKHRVEAATPIEHHARQCVQAMETGKHVLCEQTAATHT